MKRVAYLTEGPLDQEVLDRIRKVNAGLDKPHGEENCRDWVMWRAWYREDVRKLLAEIDRLRA
jgi:hypothetical protein